MVLSMSPRIHASKYKPFHHRTFGMFGKLDYSILTQRFQVYSYSQNCFQYWIPKKAMKMNWRYFLKLVFFLHQQTQYPSLIENR